MTAIVPPRGFLLATASAGFKRSGRPDLSLIISQTEASAAGVFTTNLFKAAPVVIAQKQLARKPVARAILINTGQANACTGDEGLRNCRETQELITRQLQQVRPDCLCNPDMILPASTGVIGTQLKMPLWRQAVPLLVDNLGQNTVEDVAAAMMTTDKFPKHAGMTLHFPDGPIHIAGMAKGAGMICPNMATMIAVLLCDAQVAPDIWQRLVTEAVDKTFNRVTVDGDTSTNDTVFAFANGASGISLPHSELNVLAEALEQVLARLAYMLVQDGEGSTKVLHIHVSGARSDTDASLAARTVGHSQLVKTAMYGKDANWGRIVAALGRSGVTFQPENLSLSFCGVLLFAHGGPVADNFDAVLKEPLANRDIYLDIVLGNGPGEYTLLASDLGHEYININADYRS